MIDIESLSDEELEKIAERYKKLKEECDPEETAEVAAEVAKDVARDEVQKVA
jgi:hypothetical protein